MLKLFTIAGAAAFLALAGCNSNESPPDATATEPAADTDVGMGDALASDSAMSGVPTDMAPTATDTGTATLQGPGTGAPSPAVTAAPTSGATP